ncbi:unnamed protein product, partial [Rotaria sordida]
TKPHTDEEQTPLIFFDDNGSKVIFNDCQAAIFFIGEPKQAMNAGTMAHLLMCAGLEMDIGMCPIDRRNNFPLKVNNALDEISIS